MRLLIFPRGLTYFAPSDRLGPPDGRAGADRHGPRARTLVRDGSTARWNPDNALGLLQQALVLADAAEALEKRIRVEGVKTGRITALDLPGQIREAQALGIVTAAEAARCADYDAKVMDLVNVDDFAPHEIGTRGALSPPS